MKPLKPVSIAQLSQAKNIAFKLKSSFILSKAIIEPIWKN
jgi:hypothetical protein